jgi:hypothetical protein
MSTDMSMSDATFALQFYRQLLIGRPVAGVIA